MECIVNRIFNGGKAQFILNNGEIAKKKPINSLIRIDRYDFLNIIAYVRLYFFTRVTNNH